MGFNLFWRRSNYSSDQGQVKERLDVGDARRAPKVPRTERGGREREVPPPAYDREAIHTPR